jgi:cyclin B
MDIENQNSFKKQEEIEIYIDDNEQKMELELNNNELPSINKNPQNVQEYFSDIFKYFFEIESTYLPIPNYMDSQNDINEKMRGILNDWLIEVHLKYKLVPDTMYLTINLIDRYLSKKKVLRTKLQLVGVTAMFIASKYEEIFPPEAKDFVYITDNACNKKELLDMEIDMLTTLNFDITFPSQYRFLELFKQVLNLSDIMFNYSYYLLDLCLISYKMIKYKFSELAATAVLMSPTVTAEAASNNFGVAKATNAISPIALKISSQEFPVKSTLFTGELPQYANIFWPRKPWPVLA